LAWALKEVEMAGKRYDGDRACCCNDTDATCAGLAVRRLSQDRVRELVEEIWTASTGRMVPARPMLDPRGSRPGASAQAAYRRHRQQEREVWRRGWLWRAAAVLATAVGGGLLIGSTVGAWLGLQMALLAALLTAWRLRFRPSASASVWRRQAAMQRRTARALRPLEREGYLVLHDVTLPGWPASLDHLVVGSTGVYAIGSWRRGRLALLRKSTSPWQGDGAMGGLVRGLRWEAAAIADALVSGDSILVRPLLCVHGGMRQAGRRSVESTPVATPQRLADVVREGAPLEPGDVQRVTAHALEVLRPAA
jgi:hypothetical protein